MLTENIVRPGVDINKAVSTASGSQSSGPAKGLPLHLGLVCRTDHRVVELDPLGRGGALGRGGEAFAVIASRLDETPVVTYTVQEEVNYQFLP